VNLYAESSAVLAWLLGEEGGHRVREVLRRAGLVMASDLTLIECDRVLIRAVTLGEIDEAEAGAPTAAVPLALILIGRGPSRSREALSAPDGEV